MLILMESQLAQYIPVLMLGALAATFAFGTLLASAILGKTGYRSRIKDTAYECGMLPVGEGSARFSVKFYLVAMLFILFDVEVVFLYPWAVVYKDMLVEHAHLIFGSMMIFLALFLVGFIYEIKKKAFDWKS
jgi:NADH-quinone oxidoreductase subunit A